ncbi:MAG: OmpL47-type beta-barrel domain-containing protein [Acidimicrobiia bacterium]
MKRLLKVLIVPASVVAALTVSAVVWALWTASGTGSAGTISTSLGVPGKPTAVATMGSGTVPVSWTGITSPSGNAADVTYYVVRDGGTAACNTTGLTCSDTSVPDGPHTYTVQAKFKSWNSQISLASDSVTVVNDIVPPTTSLEFDSAATAGWHKADVKVTLTADDHGGSGVDFITYSTSGAQTIGATEYSVPFTITAEGTTTISFFATDEAGNPEEIQTQTVKLDKTRPFVSTPRVG